MTIAQFPFRWRLVTTAALLLALPLPAFAQSEAPENRATAGRALSQHLNTLSSDSHNVRALVGAGDAALALDDPNAAIGFFGRAEEIDPRNGRCKAGLARALLMLEKPRDALRFFDQAIDLGVSEGEIARDRGLAYDLRGDQKRAQRDYALAQRRGSDPEVVRRMALSLGISGDREQALKLLEPLLYKQDKAAWRARAFVLAMTGDVEGANGVARQVMPGNLARPMAYFFSRIGRLSPAQKAAAVHYGQMPSDGRTDGLVYAEADVPVTRARPADGGLIPAGDPLGPRAADQPAARPSARPSREPRRRPGREETGQLASITAAQAPAPPVATRPAGPTTQTNPTRLATAETRPTAPAATDVTLAAARPGANQRIETRLNTRIGPVPRAAQPLITPEPKLVQLAGLTALPPPSQGASPLVTSAAPATEAVVSTPAPATGTTAPIATDFSLTPAAPTPTVTTTPSSPPSTQSAPVSASSAPASAASPPISSTLADIVGALELEQPVIVPPPVPAPRKAAATEPVQAALGKRADDAKVEAKKSSDRKPSEKKAPPKPDPKKAEPSRIWAQIATGSDKAALARDYQKAVKKAPAAFRGQAGWTAAFRSSRRLLVGPFDSQKKAQDFLAKAEAKGFVWTSAAGEAVEKLPLK